MFNISDNSKSGRFDVDVAALERMGLAVSKLVDM
jgi:hypothetical protein